MKRLSNAGAPTGNRNAVKHGCSTAEGRAKAAADRAIEAIERLTAKIEALDQALDNATFANPVIAKALANVRRKRASAKRVPTSGKQSSSTRTR